MGVHYDHAHDHYVVRCHRGITTPSGSRRSRGVTASTPTRQTAAHELDRRDSRYGVETAARGSQIFERVTG